MMAFTSLQPNLTPLFLLLTAVTIVCLSKIGGLKSGSRLENSDGTHLSNDSVRDLFEVEVGSTPEKHFCFKDMCTCTRDKADCSRNYGNLTFVPRFANNIRTLNFSNK
ncbi:hypothetical protein BaRGS_00028235 [Batillaria attramentaria]|uniref:Uncharacterized protein n=1 Tax=Batillaria attramentaria TaxID=370345 RepID=A0ABD0JZI6_9CAEN